MSNTISGFISVALPNTLDNENIIDSALSGYLPLDGSSAMLGDLDMNTHNIKNLANATNNDEAVNLGQVNTALLNYVTLNTDQTITGIKTLRGSGLETRLTIQKPPLYAGYSYLNFTDSTSTTLWDFGVEPSPANNMYIYNGSLAQIFIKFDFASALTELYTTLKMNNNWITNLLDPVNNQDASTKFYVDNLLNNYVTLNTVQTITAPKIISTPAFIPLTLVNDGNNYLMVMTSNSNSSVGAPIQINRARGTVAVPTSVLNNDSLFGIYSTGYGTSSYGNNTTAIIFQATENYTDTAKGSRIIFGCTNTGSASRTTRLTIGENGLDVNGSINMNTTNKIINLATPTLNTDATTKLYVDNAITTGLTNYVTTNTAQTITGIKTFSGVGNIEPLTTFVTTGDCNIRIQSTNAISNEVYIELSNTKAGTQTTSWGIGMNDDEKLHFGYGNNGTMNKTDYLVIDKDLLTITLNGALNMNTTNKIINLATPTLNTDATTKLYVDNAITTGLTNYVTRNTAQTITAVKTFDGTTNKIILNSLDNKTENLLVYSLLGSIRWTAGIFSTALNPNSNYTIRKDNTTPILTIDYNSPSLSLNNYKIIDLATPTLNTDATTKLYVDNAVTTGLTNYVTTNTNQTITAIKTISNTSASLILNKTVNTGFCYLRYNNVSTPVWDTGMDNIANGNQFYWFNQATRVMTLTTTGNLGLSGTCTIAGNTTITAGTLNMNTTNKIINLANPTSDQDAVTKFYSDNGKTLTTINNFTYDNEDLIELSSNVARTITFNNLNNYHKGKKFTMIITNTGLVSTVFTFDITGTGTFPGGTTTKTQTLPVGNKSLYTCVIENLNYNYLYINPTPYLL